MEGPASSTTVEILGVLQKNFWKIFAIIQWGKNNLSEKQLFSNCYERLYEIDNFDFLKGISWDTETLITSKTYSFFMSVVVKR